MPVVAGGLNPVWIVAALIFCGIHAWWGIPLVLAGAMQRRYMTVTSPRLRSALAEQARDIISPLGLRQVYGGERFCRGDRCGARMAAAANFCPRCGTPVWANPPQGLRV